MSATTRPMTCDDLDPLARDAARGALDDALLARVHAHLRGCGTCADRLEQERRLDARLTALSASAPPSPPPALEQRLTHSFRARFTGPVPAAPAAPDGVRPERATGARGGTWGWRAWLAVGSFTLAAGVMALLVLAPGREPERAVVSHERSGVPAAVEERPAVPVRAPGEVGRVAAGPPFVALGWDGADRPIELGRITRVHMPTALAVRFGWPLLPDAPDARIAADVLVGEDGTARALRFLPATFTPLAHPRP